MEEDIYIDSSIYDIPPMEEEQPKPKKRGRKPKYNKDFCSEFPNYISNILVPYIKDKELEIKEIFENEDYISKEQWIKLRDLISPISLKMQEYNKFVYKISCDISKRPPSAMRGIDYSREIKSKEIILKFLNLEDTNINYKYYEVYLHVSKYLDESSKEFKL